VNLADIVATIIFVGIIAYAVFGGADYGAGIWDLLAGEGHQAAERRHQIDRSLGPVWEANHVWLVFVLVFLWTGFPSAFAATVTTLFVPLALAAVGIVYRGAAFAFRKSVDSFAQARWFGALFAASSVVTPFFFGTVAGAVASGRVPADGRGDPVTSWVNPTSLLGGVLAVATCAWSAAVLLAADAERADEPELATWFARRALLSGLVTGTVALLGVAVLEHDAKTLAAHLRGRGAPLVAISAAAATTALVLIHRGRYRAARPPALVAVVAVVAGWGVAHYPWVLVDHSRIDAVAAPRATLVALLVAFAGALVLVVPALLWLLRLTDAGSLGERARADSSEALLDANRGD
jgi:cytochrome d ubiquinol oxidase subunit II